MEDEEFDEILNEIEGGNANFNNIISNLSELMNKVDDKLEDDENGYDDFKEYLKMKILEEL